jgi:hypothetical protein
MRIYRVKTEHNPPVEKIEMMDIDAGGTVPEGWHKTKAAALGKGKAPKGKATPQRVR